MNKEQLIRKCTSAMDEIVRREGSVTPVDVLLATGLLDKKNYEAWREGRITELEAACSANMDTLATVNKVVRTHAQEMGLKKAYEPYYKTGKGRVKLRFTRSGRDDLERHYSTRYVDTLFRTEKEARAELEDEG